MDNKLTKELYRKHARLLPNSIPIQCDNGWYHIIDVLLDTIKFHIQHNNPKLKFRVDTIKEKFGALRFYYNVDVGDSRIEGMVSAMEQLSAKVCEQCGSPEGKIENLTSWRKCLCPSCLKIYGDNE
jgi:hypothetical protein